ncbi:hypothetical protein [Yoonia sediminilitoris]|uniref:Tail tube protein n=1 Tax=Yoonia sediminilitoris TaxID=1286148 RepID=A0A2T6KBW8_9RHOB|nr:hypothetical protein [Yoonia sediminilitoris]PUB12411.1 hypothetical protein C8N45_11050 [Yoonia sediminilitoris]RCW93105.1 hypothetical protein DFP92_11050 [Yoonia sediminilitoris]
MANTNVFTGGDATLTLAPLDTPPGSDAESIISRYDIATAVGRVTGVRFTVQTDLREFFEIGFRHVTSLHEGDIHIAGEADRAYINGALLGLLTGRKSFVDNNQRTFQPEFNMTLQLDDPAVAGEGRLTLNGVKFQSWSFALPEDDIVMEKVSFRAKSVDIADFDDDSGVSAGPVFVSETE